MPTRNNRSANPKDHLDAYQDNLDVIENYSFYNLKSDLVIIKTPVPNQNYDVRGVYNISKNNVNEIFIHISDGTVIPSRGRNKKNILGIIFNFKEIIDSPGATKLNLKGKKDPLKIVVFNDDSNEINSQNIMKMYDSTFNEQPQEKGNGVIIEGP